MYVCVFVCACVCLCVWERGERACVRLRAHSNVLIVIVSGCPAVGNVSRKIRCRATKDFRCVDVGVIEAVDPRQSAGLRVPRWRVRISAEQPPSWKRLIQEKVSYNLDFGFTSKDPIIVETNPQSYVATCQMPFFDVARKVSKLYIWLNINNNVYIYSFIISENHIKVKCLVLAVNYERCQLDINLNDIKLHVIYYFRNRHKPRQEFLQTDRRQ